LSNVNNQHGIQPGEQDFDKKSLYSKRYTAKRLTDEFHEKSWRKRGVNKLYKSGGTQALLTGTTTGSFQSHPDFIEENNHAFVCLNI